MEQLAADNPDFISLTNMGTWVQSRAPGIFIIQKVLIRDHFERTYPFYESQKYTYYKKKAFQCVQCVKCNVHFSQFQIIKTIKCPYVSNK